MFDIIKFLMRIVAVWLIIAGGLAAIYLILLHFTPMKLF
jgi:uncharacterized membrane protein